MEPRHFLLEDFELQGTERSGGMALVRKATLIAEKVAYALKSPKRDSGEDATAASFNREVSALSNLEQANIVRLLGIGTDGTQRFIVLEWLEETLQDKLRVMGPYDWVTFYEQIGRPLLMALQYAHGRDVAHRDLKPMNVMFTRTGIPKITDFGIAKVFAGPSIGLTFAGAGSHPWTPAEIDNGIHSEIRDLYSWAAIAVACLTGRQDYATASELRTSLDVLGTVVPIRALTSCLSDNPGSRPMSAIALLWDLDEFHKERLGSSDVERTVGIEFSPDVHTKLEEIMPAYSEVESRVEALLRDFAPTCDLGLLPEGDFEFAGRTLNMRGSRAHDSPWLMIKSVRPSSSDRPIEPNLHLRIRFVERINEPSAALESRASLTFLQGYLNTAVEKLRDNQQRKDEERYLLMLQDVIAARFRALRTLPALSYTDGRWDGGAFSVRLNGDEAPESGEQRLIRVGAKITVLAVSRVVQDRLYLRTIGPPRAELPVQGLLEVDTAAQKRALDRQEDALKALRNGQAVLPALKRLILRPEEAELPEASGRPTPNWLSEDKAKVLDAALGLRQLMVVQGPPGTGKTTLIAEVVKQYLKENPNARVLLTAQTHIAIDHVVTKLRELPELDGRIVRIARAGDEKVAERVRDVTLQECVIQWCSTATQRARNFARERGAKIGLDSAEVERFVRLEAMLLAIKRKRNILEELRAGSESLASAEQEAAASRDLGELQSATVAAMSVADLEHELTRLDDSITRLRDDLSQMGSDGAALANLPEDQLDEWLQVLQETHEVWRQFRQEIELQVSWIDLLGQLKQFEEPVLRSAAVVAGTCVGLGSNDAFSRTHFDLCILDEASKATATEALIPMVRSERILIVGDPKQLPPFDNGPTDLEDYSDAEVKQTFLDHLMQKLPRDCIHQLTHQHRMCEAIGELVSHAFYDKSLINSRPNGDRPVWMQKKFPKPVVWVNTGGSPQKQQGHTYVNVGEQDAILEILKQLQHGAGRAQAEVTVSVIAGYAAQAYALEARIQKNSFGSLLIEVATVDSFQGRETDVTIFSVTLSNSKEFLGFLRSAKRLNVALSRPRDLLAIVGDQLFCYGVGGDNPFVRVVDHINSHAASCETRNVSN